MDDFKNFDPKQIDDAFSQINEKISSLKEILNRDFTSINEGVANEVEKTLAIAKNNSKFISLLSEQGLMIFNSTEVNLTHTPKTISLTLTLIHKIAKF